MIRLDAARPVHFCDGLSRRDFLRRGRALGALAAGGSLGSIALSGCGRPAGVAPIKVGILHSQTGSMALSETALRDVEMMAIEEINDAGTTVLFATHDRTLLDVRPRRIVVLDEGKAIDVPNGFGADEYDNRLPL